MNIKNGSANLQGIYITQNSYFGLHFNRQYAIDI